MYLSLRDNDHIVPHANQLMTGTKLEEIKWISSVVSSTRMACIYLRYLLLEVMSPEHALSSGPIAQGDS